MNVNAGNDNVEIEEFDIILAREKSAILAEKVKGNSYDLKNFQKTAKARDRIVIKVNKVKPASATELTDKNSVIRIQIK
ncbi:MAG: hypothetical protein WD824_20045 [Cyclobacteriaceae bacterium]